MSAFREKDPKLQTLRTISGAEANDQREPAWEKMTFRPPVWAMISGAGGHRPDRGPNNLSHPDTGSRGRVGWIVAGSLLAGLVIGLLLVAAPFVPVAEGELTGALLCGFAIGWAMLAVLSVRFSDRPQRWAAAPAVFMGSGGLLLLGFGSSAHGLLKWVWPPALLVLVLWMVIRCRPQLPSRSRWLLYPVFAVLLIASLGGAYETVGELSDTNGYPMIGQSIDVGGHMLYLRCTGSGSPTVVLEPGAGETSSAFGWIEPEVARATRVCVYDRAGRGRSEPADVPQDATAVATDLHTLLERGAFRDPMCWVAIRSAASMFSRSPPFTPTMSLGWC